MERGGIREDQFELVSRSLRSEYMDIDLNDLASELYLARAYKVIWFSQMSWSRDLANVIRF